MRVFRYARGARRAARPDGRGLPRAGPGLPVRRRRRRLPVLRRQLNQVWQLSKNTVEATNHNLYVDSWTRERDAYEADSYLQMMANFFVSSDPTLGNYSIDYLLTGRTWPTEWPMYTILAIHDSYQQTGDIAAAGQRNYASLVDKLPTSGSRQSTGLIRKDFGSNGCEQLQTDCDIVDWPASERDGYVFRPVQHGHQRDRLPQLHGHGSDRHGTGQGCRRSVLHRHRRASPCGHERVAVGRRDGGLPGRTQRRRHAGAPLAIQASVFATRVRGAGRRPRRAGRRLHRHPRHGSAASTARRFCSSRCTTATGPTSPTTLLTSTGLRSWMNMINDGCGRHDGGLGRHAEAEPDLLTPVGRVAGVQRAAGNVRHPSDDAGLRHVRRPAAARVGRTGRASPCRPSRAASAPPSTRWPAGPTSASTCPATPPLRSTSPPVTPPATSSTSTAAQQRPCENAATSGWTTCRPAATSSAHCLAANPRKTNA